MARRSRPRPAPRAGGRPAAVALLGLLCACAAGCATRPAGRAQGEAPRDAPAEALAWFSDGFRRELHGEPDEAAASYARALALDPGSEPLYMRVAMLRLRQNRPEEAVRTMTGLAEAHPGSPQPWRWIARVRLSQDRIEEAVSALRRAVELDPANPVPLAELAAAYTRGERFGEAVEVLAGAIARVPDPARLLPAAGEAFIRAGAEGDEAAAGAARGLLGALAARNGTDPDFLLRLGNIYLAGKEPRAALEAYGQACRLAPERPEPYVRSAVVLLSLDRGDEAVAMVTAAVDRVDRPLELLGVLADMHVRRAAKQAQDDPKAARGEREAAISAMRRILEAAPGNDGVRFRLGELLLLQDRPKEAAAELARIRTDDPQEKRRIASRLLAAGDAERAIANLAELAQEEPDNASLRYLLGELYERQDRKDEALAAYEQASLADPPEAAPFLKRAWLLSDSDPAAALAVLEEGQARLPGDPRLVEMEALLYRRDGAFDKAAAAYRVLQGLMREDEGGGADEAALLADLATVLDRTGQSGEALDALAEAAGNDVLALERFVQVSAALDEKHGGADSTRALLDALAERLPDEPAVHLFAGLYESFGDRYGAAIAAFEKAEAAASASGDPGGRIRAPFYFWFGSACERDGQYDRAVGLLERCIELDPEHADALNYVAYMWAEKGRELDKALAYVRRALAVYPDSAAYLDTLGWVYYRQGRLEEALETLRTAAARQPDDPTIEDHLGDALARLGRDEEALAHWRRAFVLDPASEAVQGKLEERGVDLEPLRAEAAERAARRKEPAPGVLADPGGEDEPPADAREDSVPDLGGGNLDGLGLPASPLEPLPAP